MVPNWLRSCSLGLGLALAGMGCLGGGNSGGSRATLSLGPEGMDSPVAELPAKRSAYVCAITAQEFERNNRVTEALGLYDKARTLDPSMDKHICRRMAVLYDQLGKFTKADEEYDKALVFQPKNADLLNDLGYSYYCRGDWAKAEEKFNEAVDINPVHKRAWINLGMAMAQQGHYPESLKAFKNATTEAESFCNLAFILAANGDKERAKQAYRKALELSPHLQLAQVALDRFENPLPVKTPTPMPTSTKDGPKLVPTLKPATPDNNDQTASPRKSPYMETKLPPIVIDPELDATPSLPRSETPSTLPTTIE